MTKAAAFSWAIILTCCLIVKPALAGTDDRDRRAVAKVNGKVLFMDQLEPILKARGKPMAHRGPVRPEPEGAIQRRALEQLIEVELLTQKSRTLNIPGLAERVDARIDTLRQTQPSMFGEKSEAQIRELVTDEFRVETYLQQQGVTNPEIPEAEIRAFYNQGQQNFRREEAVHLRHITIQLPADASAERKAVARELLQRTRQLMLAGASFEKAAQEALRDPGGFQGDLGLLTRRDMPEAIAWAAFTLDPGKVSEILDSPSGIHLVEVLERRPAGIAPYEEMRDFLRQYLQEGRSRQIYQNLVRSLRQQADIVILPEPG